MQTVKAFPVSVWFVMKVRSGEAAKYWIVCGSMDQENLQ